MLKSITLLPPIFTSFKFKVNRLAGIYPVNITVKNLSGKGKLTVHLKARVFDSLNTFAANIMKNDEQPKEGHYVPDHP